MQDLINQRVIVADTTGYTTEGDLLRFEHDGALSWAVLTASRQLSHVDVTTDPPTVEAFEIPGENRIALHLVARIHLTHLIKKPAKRGR